MNNTDWLLFSFSVPSKLQGFRVKIWRKLNALGAVQIKNSIYVLPADDHHQEQLTWLAKETDEQGGEALIIAGGALLTMPDEHVRAAFRRARDEEYAALEEELRAHVGTAEGQELQSLARKYGRKLEALQAIDFFPSGKGRVVERMIEGLLRSQAQPSPAVAALDAGAYRGKTWVTRAAPYVDRLASFWLVRRFIDAEARIMFLAPSEPVPLGPEWVSFDMAEADFTHTGGLISFEVILEAFGLGDVVPARMRQVIRAIDLEELETAPTETPGVKRMLDGLAAAHPDDQTRTDLALVFFDTLRASYSDTPDPPAVN